MDLCMLCSEPVLPSKPELSRDGHWDLVDFPHVLPCFHTSLRKVELQIDLHCYAFANVGYLCGKDKPIVVPLRFA